jgi:S-adenosylmethionine synthetase
VSVRVDTQGTGKVAEEKLCDAVRKAFPLTPRGIIEYLDLRRPIFASTSSGGHFGRSEPDFKWEATNKVEELKKLVS